MAEGPQYPDSDFSDDDQSPLEESFFKAADHLRKITNKLNNDQLLELYALFKQGTEGKCYTLKPGWFDGRGRKKWDAWNALGDMSKDEAMKRYIALLQEYDPGTDLESPSKDEKKTWMAVSSLRHSEEPDLDHDNLTILDLAREDLGDMVAQFLSKQPELKYVKDADGMTALHWAADRDATSALTAALEGGCPIDAIDESGQTALHYAASCGHVESTKILVDKGASILKDKEGNTPVDLASEDEVLKILEGAKKI